MYTKGELIMPTEELELEMQELKNSISPADYANDEEFKAIDEEIRKENEEVDKKLEELGLKPQKSEEEKSLDDQLAELEAEVERENAQDVEEWVVMEKEDFSEQPKVEEKKEQEWVVMKKEDFPEQPKEVSNDPRTYIPGRNNPSEVRDKNFLSTTYNPKEVSVDSSVSMSKDFEKQFKDISKELLGAGRFIMTGSKEYKDLKKAVEDCSKLMDKKNKMKLEEYQKELQEKIEKIITQTGKYFNHKGAYSEDPKSLEGQSSTAKARYTAANKMWNLLVDKNKELDVHQKTLDKKEKVISEIKAAGRKTNKNAIRDERIRSFNSKMLKNCENIVTAVSQGNMKKAVSEFAQLLTNNKYRNALYYSKGKMPTPAEFNQDVRNLIGSKTFRSSAYHMLKDKKACEVFSKAGELGGLRALDKSLKEFTKNILQEPEKENSKQATKQIEKDQVQREQNQTMLF